jgi:hypothetical protein
MVSHRAWPVLGALPTRMLGVSLLSPATSLARSAVEAKVRTAAREQLVERATAPNGRATASRMTIVFVGVW